MSADLDPSDWPAFRREAHGMLDNILDSLENIRLAPVWQPIPEDLRGRFREAEVPRAASDLGAVHQEFMRDILPYSNGNPHPGFMGWVHGGGTAVGVVAEMLAAGLNANLGGRDHAPIEIERQVARWMAHIFNFPEISTGLFVTGTSMANLIGVLVARDSELAFEARRRGVQGIGMRLTAYASNAAHSSIGKAMDVAGLGSDALRGILTDGRHRIDLDELASAIAQDRRAGLTPFLIVGNCGTVDTGAIDDLEALAALARRERLWFHVDGALGALAILAPDLAPKLKGIERADSLAFDFHKWGQVPYDAGFILVRDGELHRKAFETSARYLKKEARGLAAGAPWPCDFGVDLSRGFRALKTWFTLKVYGTEALGTVISNTCALARYLEERVIETPALELMAPVELNIVCFRYRGAAASETEAARINPEIVIRLQNGGLVAPSSTTIGGRVAIRAAIVNHRTTKREIDTLVEQTLVIGGELAAAAPQIGEEPRDDARQSALRDLEVRLAQEPGRTKLYFERACLLNESGRTTEARDAYLELLTREPDHRLALNNLGTLLYETGYRTAARTAYGEAVERHPDDPMGRVNLGNVLYECGEVGPAREQFEMALRFDPGNSGAHRGLAYVFDELNDPERAERHRRQGFANLPAIGLPYRGQGEPVSLLLLVSAIGGNIPTRQLLDDRVFRTFVVTPDFYDPAVPLPPHRVVFNAIGDADLAGSSLVAAQSLVALTGARLINAPSAVLSTGRADQAARLARLTGVVTPLTVTLRREVLASRDAESMLECHGFRFPLLVRTPGFHTGRHFVKVDSPLALPEAIAGLPGDELMVIEFLNARGGDGKVRKYRVMTIGGELYPLHLAISSHWKIHYFSAEMAADSLEDAANRAEDARFLADMPAAVGDRAVDALQRIQEKLGLDYGGIDFGVSAAGDVLLFEANATMVVNPPPPGELWAYRHPAVERIFGAVRRMLTERAAG